MSETRPVYRTSVQPAGSELGRARDALDALCLAEQPDLAGLIVGRVLAMLDSRPDFDARTAEAVLFEVGQAIRHWRSEWTRDRACPLCNRTE